jgi:hypothetical protein
MHLKIITVDSLQKSIKGRSVEIVKTCAQGGRTPPKPPPPTPPGVASVICIPPGRKVFRRKYSFFTLILYAFYSSVFFTLVYTQGNADFTKDAYEMFRKFIYLLFTQG